MKYNPPAIRIWDSRGDYVEVIALQIWVKIYVEDFGLSRQSVYARIGIQESEVA